MKKTKETAAAIVDQQSKFKGYTIEELRYQRAMMALRKEFCKAKVMESVQGLRPGGSSRIKSDHTSSKMAIVSKIAGTLFSNLNTLDYILMGISLFGTARKGYRLIRGKK